MKLEVPNFARDKKIAVALSGGLDSTVLLSVLIENEYKVIAINVNHRLRSGSSDDVFFIKQITKNLGIESYFIDWDHKKVASNVSEKSRNARYKFMTELCKKLNIEYLMTAHHKDDQVETLLMRITRGTGISGLLGIRRETDINGITVIRPLLDNSRQEILRYAMSKDLIWIFDETNASSKYRRSQLRFALDKVSDKNSLTNNLSALAKHSCDVVDALDFYTLQELSKYTEKKGSIFQIDKRLFCCPREIYSRAIIYLIRELSNREVKTERGKIDNLICRIQKGSLPYHIYGITIVNKKNHFIIQKENS